MGLISLSCFGQPLGNYEAHALHKSGGQEINLAGQFAQGEQQMIPRNMKIQSIRTDGFDPVLKEKVDILQQQKEEALEVEDYDQCKFLKSIIDKLMIVGNQLVSL